LGNRNVEADRFSGASGIDSPVRDGRRIPALVGIRIIARKERGTRYLSVALRSWLDGDQIATLGKHNQSVVDKECSTSTEPVLRPFLGACQKVNTFETGYGARSKEAIGVALVSN